jgi:hypothetical protein
MDKNSQMNMDKAQLKLGLAKIKLMKAKYDK